MTNIERAAKRLENTTMRKLTTEYNIALKAVQKEMQSVYAKYSVDGSLSMAQMAKYNRLQSLEKSINKELGRVSGITTKSVNKLKADVYQEAFYRRAFEIEKGTGLNLNYGKLPTKQVEAAIANPYTLIALENNKDMIRRNIRRDVTQGIIQGKGYREVAKDIKKSLETNLNNADRIARTEGHRAREQGNFDSMKEAEELGVVMKKQWVSTLDDRTRKEHQGADGQKVDVDNPFDVDGEELMYPGDPSGSAGNTIKCRCTMINLIEDIKPNTRASKAGPIPANITYIDWLDIKNGKKTIKDFSVTKFDDLEKKLLLSKREIAENAKKLDMAQMEIDDYSKNKYNQLENRDIKTLKANTKKDLDAINKEIEMTSKQMEQNQKYWDSLSREQKRNMKDIREEYNNLESKYYKIWETKSEVEKDYNRIIGYEKWLSSGTLKEKQDKLAILTNSLSDSKQKAKAIVKDINIEKNSNITSLAGAKKGAERTIEEARGEYLMGMNTYSSRPTVNPNYLKGGGYSINCQTCVVAHEARSRGFDVVALANTKGSKLEELSRNTSLAYIDKATGNAPDRKILVNASTPSKVLKELKNELIEDARYTMQFTWKGNRSAHIISVSKNKGKIELFDPQIGNLIASEREVLDYFKRFSFAETWKGTKFKKRPELLRVDDKLFNKEFVDQVVTRGD